MDGIDERENRKKILLFHHFSCMYLEIKRKHKIYILNTLTSWTLFKDSAPMKYKISSSFGKDLTLDTTINFRVITFRDNYS